MKKIAYLCAIALFITSAGTFAADIGGKSKQQPVKKAIIMKKVDKKQKKQELIKVKKMKMIKKNLQAKKG